MSMILSGKKDVYLEILEKYRGYIQAGVYAPGERLPSVRTIASDIGVNPNTVAKAFSLLEEQGYIRSLPKKGMYVAYPPASSSLQTETTETTAAEQHALLSEMAQHLTASDLLSNPPPEASDGSLVHWLLRSFKSAGFGYEEVLTQLKEVYGIHD